MKSNLLASCIFASAFLAIGQAGVVLDTGTISLNSGDTTQLGRLNRNGIPSDWSVSKAYPGLVNPTTSYHYRTFTVMPVGSFVQVSIDEPAGVLFASAYFSSYNASSLST